MKICLLLTTLFLCLLSVSDLRTRTIPGWAAPVFGAGTGLLHLFLRDLSAGAFFAAADLAAGFAAGEEGAAESTFVIVFGVLETVVFFGAAFFSGASCSGVFFSAMMSLLFSD